MFCLIKNLLDTYEIDKISLSYFDDKRCVSDDGIYILSYFHKNSVTSSNNWKDRDYGKKNEIIEKNCNNWKKDFLN